MEPKLARAGMETYAMITTVEIEWMRTAFSRAQDFAHEAAAIGLKAGLSGYV